MCSQRPSYGAKGKGRGNGSVNFIGFTIASVNEDDSLSEMDEEISDTATETNDLDDEAMVCESDLLFEEDLDYYEFEKGKSPDGTCLAAWSAATGPGGLGTYAAMSDLIRGQAIIDSGASENIVGEDTLQDLAQCLAELDFDPAAEIEVDRQIHKNFTYGNNQTNAGLGLSHVNAGICGQQVEVQAHMVEGGTPFLLSSKFLYDMDATINFRTGLAIFKRLSDRQSRLERSPSNHLLLPMTAFAGREDLLSRIWVAEECPVVKELSENPEPDALHVCSDRVAQGDPPQAAQSGPP